MLAVAALVALRLALGCHFLYEGVWKITHQNEFTAEPFLTQAKGPIAPLFYAMVPDIDGEKRLQITTHDDGKKSLSSNGITTRWNGIYKDFVAFYGPYAGNEAAGEKDDAARKKFEQNAEQTYKNFDQKLEDYFQANREEILAHFESLDRFENDKERRQGAPFQKQRRWERMMDLRQEGNKWIKDIEAQEKAFKNSLSDLLSAEQKERGPVAAAWNPLTWGQMDFINFSVTYGLTAIGICLMLGFCTPLAALGGAAFMCFVVMTQPAFPSIFPHDPPVVGHALLVNKDFVEMVALLVTAAVSTGRWGGLDFFLYRWIINPFLARRNQKQS